jgi:integrase
VDFASRTIRVRAETTKTRRDRFVPLSPGSIRELRRLRADNESRFPGKPNVFLSIEGNPLRPATLGLQVRRFCAAHGIDLHLHGLRHLAATHVVRATGSLTLAAKLLGHTKISTTAGSMSTSRRRLAGAHEKAGMLDGILSRRKPGPKGNPR